MFASGMSYKDITSHIEEIYDHKISAAAISNITDRLLPIINEWRNRPLQSIYSIWMVCFSRLKMRGDSVYIIY